MNKVKSFLAAALLVGALASPAFADSFSVTIGNPPPAPIVEAIPAAPGPMDMYVWRPGYWRWVDERHIWVPGHWAQRPHPHAEWEAPRWDHDGDHYRFYEGHWRDHDEHHDEHGADRGNNRHDERGGDRH